MISTIRKHVTLLNLIWIWLGIDFIYAKNKSIYI